LREERYGIIKYHNSPGDKRCM